MTKKIRTRGDELNEITEKSLVAIVRARRALEDIDRRELLLAHKQHIIGPEKYKTMIKDLLYWEYRVSRLPVIRVLEAKKERRSKL